MYASLYLYVMESIFLCSCVLYCLKLSKPLKHENVTDGVFLQLKIVMNLYSPAQMSFALFFLVVE